jgi:hypothetical protein
MSDADRNLAALVAAHRWAVVKIPEDDRGPGFAYTVGLHQAFAHPELLMSGLPLDTLHAVLNDIASQVASGVRFADGETSADVLEDYSVAFRAIAPEAFGTYLGAAMRFYGAAPFPALHVLWPDRAGRFPWERGVDPWTRWAQPALSDGPEPTTMQAPSG